MPVVNRTEYVEINSVPLATPAWWVQDPTPLLDRGPLRGADRIIPFTDGQQALQRRTDEFRVVLALYVTGAADQNGTLASNQRSQLTTNIDYLLTNVFTPNSSSPWTRTLNYHRADSTTKTAPCIVVPPFAPVVVNRGRGTMVLGALDIIIPAGVLS